MKQLNYQARRERIGSLDCVVIAPAVPPEGPVVPIAKVGLFCHGYGAAGDDLVGLAGELLRSPTRDDGKLLIFPTAPLSLDEQGMPGGRAWWMLSIQRLISAMEEGRYEQIREEIPAGIDDARQKLTDAINIVLDRCGLTPKQLLLGGFSQGAMLAVETALRGLAQPPAQLCIYSGALVCESLWKPLVGRLRSTQVLQSHGRFDPILPLQTGRWLRDFIQSSGCPVEFIEFNGPHTIPPAAIERTMEMLSEDATD